MSSGKKLKICHVITRMIVGGAQENTLLTIKGHLAAGHEVVLVTGPSPGREGELKNFVELPDFRVVELPCIVRSLSPVDDLRAYFALKRFFRSEKFDVVHTHSSKAGILGRFAARAAGVPVVVHTVHGQAFHRYEKPWRNWLYIHLERWAARRCDRIYSVAQAMIDQCVAAKVAPREKYMVVYSGMATDAFASVHPDGQLRERLGIPAGSPVIVTVARLFELKGYEFVIPAAAELAGRFPDLHWLIVGDGPLYDRLHEELAALGLAERFHFAGLVAPAEVKNYIALGTLLWHLSLREGLPRSVVQALATGIPAVGFALDGTPEVVLNGETGYTVTPESVPEVVEATARLLGDPGFARRLGMQGRKLVLEKFDWRRMADILEQEYLRLCELKSGKRD